MKTYSASKYVSVNTFNRMSEKDRDEMQKQLVQKCKDQINVSDDPVDKLVQRDQVLFFYPFATTC